jgi:hypothetical protein
LVIRSTAITTAASSAALRTCLTLASSGPPLSR